MIDCSRPFHNHGCNGGWVDRAFKYIIKSGGIESNQQYPYVAREQKCHFRHNSIVTRLQNYRHLQTGNELLLQKMVATFGPIAAALDSTL